MGMTERSLAGTISSELSEEELRHLREFFSFCPDLLCVLSAEGRLLIANESVAALVGRERSELQAKQFIDLFHDDDRDSIGASLQTLEAAGKTRFRKGSGRCPRRRHKESSRSTKRGRF